MILSKMIDTLQDKPFIGILGAITGWGLANLKAFMTDDVVLSGISICGIWVGFFIALVTLIIKLVELSRLLGSWVMQLRTWIKAFKKK